MQVTRTVFPEFVGIVVDHGLLRGRADDRRDVERSSHEDRERGKEAEACKSYLHICSVRSK